MKMDEDKCECGNGKYKFQDKCWTCKEKERLAYDSEDAIKNEGTTSDRFICCPYCGSDYGTDEMHESQKCDCDGCGKEFYVEIEYSASYTTSKVNK